MRGFRAERGGWQAVLEAHEVRVLHSLAQQLRSVLTSALDSTDKKNDTKLDRPSEAEITPEAVAAGGRSRPTAEDPVIARLLPNAYRDDPEAADEWRRLSRRGLVERKTSFADRMAADLEAGLGAEDQTSLWLDEAGVIDWMRAVGDLRLILAERLGVHDDGDEPDERQAVAADLYDWLAWIQDDLVRCLDAADSDAAQGDAATGDAAEGDAVTGDATGGDATTDDPHE